MIHNIRYDMHFDIKSTRGAILLRESWFADFYQLVIPNTHIPMSVKLVLSGTTDLVLTTIVLIKDLCYLKLQIYGENLFEKRFLFFQQKSWDNFFHLDRFTNDSYLNHITSGSCHVL